MARIAVIGAGMGAMATAARLAVAGHRVTVYERAGTYGGAVGRFERDGFAFDTGPGLLHLPAVYRDLFIKTGKEPLEQCVELSQVDPASRHIFADGTEVSLPNASRAGVITALDSALGADSGERWTDLINRARDAWEAARRPLLEEPLRADWQVFGRDPYPAVRRSGLLRRRPPTLAEVARRELADPRLVALLESSVLSYGLDPRLAPASATVLPYMEQTFGSWYVAGGIRALAEALYERCLARKVTFTFGAEVTGVLEKDGRAAGLELADGTLAEADSVVAAIDPWRLDALLHGAAGGPWEGLDQQAAGDVTPDLELQPPGRFTVCLALRGAREAGATHRTLVHTGDREAELDLLFGGEAGDRPTVTVLRPDDPALRPDGDHESVVLSVAAPADELTGWTSEPLVEAYADRVVAIAETAVPGLRDRVLWREVRTPAESGSIPAPALAGAEGRFLYPSNSTRLPGLYLAGGWAHPGGGLAHAGMTGALVAGLIIEGDEFRGSR